jgi:hypothetical protein
VRVAVERDLDCGVAHPLGHLQAIGSSPLIQDDVSVRGFVYDVTGKLQEIN